jgi:hypothetical protein
MRIIRHSPFGPPAIAVAKFLRTEGITPDDTTISLLAEIDRRWPGLSAHDLHGAVVLAQAFALTEQVKGTA